MVMDTLQFTTLIDDLPDASRCRGCQLRDQLIAKLRQANAQLQAQHDQQSAHVQELQTEAAGVQNRLDDLSKKQPPRPRDPEPKPPPKMPTGRKPGGQPGHPPHPRTLLPAERVRETHAYVPDTCEHCSAALPANTQPDDPEPKRHQIIDIPKTVAFAIEHQAHGRTCTCCHKVTWAKIPDGIRAHSVGANLAGTLAYLVGAHKLSKRGAVEVAEELFSAPIALGTVANLEQEMSQALLPAYDEAKKAVQAADLKHVDETGWKQNGAKRWLWVAATKLLAVFMIHPLRNSVALAKLLGTTIQGVVCSDRWRIYERLRQRRWQVCWAHLKRNFQKQVDRGGQAKDIGLRCLARLNACSNYGITFALAAARAGSCVSACADCAATCGRSFRKAAAPATPSWHAFAAVCSRSIRPCGRLSASKVSSRPTIMASVFCAWQCCGANAASAATANEAAVSSSV